MEAQAPGCGLLSPGRCAMWAVTERMEDLLCLCVCLLSDTLPLKSVLLHASEVIFCYRSVKSSVYLSAFCVPVCPAGTAVSGLERPVHVALAAAVTCCLRVLCVALSLSASGSQPWLLAAPSAWSASPARSFLPPQMPRFLASAASSLACLGGNSLLLCVTLSVQELAGTGSSGPGLGPTCILGRCPLPGTGPAQLPSWPQAHLPEGILASPPLCAGLSHK